LDRLCDSGVPSILIGYGSLELSSKGELKRADGGKNKPGKDAVKVTEDGALFRSYRDGSKFLLTPETTVQAQKKIGADIIIPLDELPGYYVDRARLEESVERTHRWEARSLQEHLKDVKDQAMYCVSKENISLVINDVALTWRIVRQVIQALTMSSEEEH
jgi:queuine tRNA-ribosyltransferase